MTEQWAWKFNDEHYDIVYHAYGEGVQRFWDEHEQHVTIITWDHDESEESAADTVTGVTTDELQATERTLRKFKATAIDEWDECPQWLTTALYAVQRTQEKYDDE